MQMDQTVLIALFGGVGIMLAAVVSYLLAVTKMKRVLDQEIMDKTRLETELSNCRQQISGLELRAQELQTQISTQNDSIAALTEAKHLSEQTVERLTAQLDAEKQQHQDSKAREQAKQSELVSEKATNHSLTQQLSEIKSDASKHLAHANQLSQQLDELKIKLAEREESLQQLQHAQSQLKADYTELRTSLDERENKHKEQLQLLEQNRAQLAKDFENLANKIFEEKGKSFTETSKQSIDAMLTPFKEQMSEFKARVEAIHTEDTKAKASLSQELEHLRKLNQQITDEASNLTKALKGDNKQQGSWGELQAEMILESSGLIKGQEFEREANFKDEEGKNKRPDLIVKLPGSKSVIIDSKVSLVAYVNSVEAEDEATRKQCLDAHVASIRTHIDGLSSKDYTNLIGMNSPDFVLMFMPIEPAFLAAVEHDRTLFNYGFERNVVLVTPTTLLPIVRTVANLWVMERSNEQARQIADQAADVFNQLCVMADRLNKVGNGLKTATNAYNGAVTAMAGQQGLYPKVSKFKELSVKVSKSLPEPNESVPEIENGKLDLIVGELEES